MMEESGYLVRDPTDTYMALSDIDEVKKEIKRAVLEDHANPDYIFVYKATLLEFDIDVNIKNEK